MTTSNLNGIHSFARSAAAFGTTTGAIATTMAAVGSHWVSTHATERFAAAFQTASAFALWHALALVGLAWAVQRIPDSRLLRAAGGCWMTGMLLFCGSLWLRGLGFMPGVVAVAPFGGSLLILGWVLATIVVVRLPKGP